MTEAAGLSKLCYLKMKHLTSYPKKQYIALKTCLLIWLATVWH